MRSRADGRAGSIARFVVATVLTGVAAGLVGALLTLLLHTVQHLAFGYTENTFLLGVERASYGRRVIALAAGGVVAGCGWWWHRQYISAADVSVTQALDGEDYVLPLGHTVVDALLQIIAVGAGASLGREGAPRQSGAAAGGWIAARLRLDPTHRRTLVACGAGAGLAAVYNVPLGGAAFTLEILLTSISLIDVIPAILTAAIATATAWPFLGDRFTYRIGAVHLQPPVLAWAVLLGPLCGIAGVVFVRLMEGARAHAATGWRSATAVAVTFMALGAAAIVYPELLGNGKGPAGLAFGGVMALGLAGALVLLKPFATAVMVASGAVGGLLTPALATGAALGVFAGRLWSLLWSGAPVVDYAIIGAATLLAVTQRAPVTAILLTLEFIGTGQALLVPTITAISLAISTAWAVDHRMAPAVFIAGASP